MANRYWNPSANANWSDANVWATTDGGDPTGVATPTSSDDVFFTSTNNYNCTVPIGVSPTCKNITFNGGTGYVGKFSSGNNSLTIYGNLTLSSGMNNSFTQSIVFAATSGTVTITTNGKVIVSKIAFNGSGGTFQLQDDLTSSYNSITDYCFQRIAGTFDANGKTVTLTGSSSVLSGTMTFYNLTKNTPGNSESSLSIDSTITISNVLTLTGYSAIKRLIIDTYYTTTLGTQKTLTVNGSISATNVSFRDINANGSASWDLSTITGGSGNMGGNTGITFTTSSTWYWHADAGNLGDYSKWYTQTNGGGSQMASTLAPLPQDILNFDSNSFDSVSQTIFNDLSKVGSIYFNGITNNPTLNFSNITYLFGSFELDSSNNMTFNLGNSLYIRGRGTNTLNLNGHEINKDTNVNIVGGSISLSGNWNSSVDKILDISSGTVDFNDYNINIGRIGLSSGTKTIRLGNGIITLFGTIANFWQFSTTAGLTFYAEDSTIKITSNLTSSDRQFEGGNLTYNNIWIYSSGTKYVTINNSNTFNDFKISGGSLVKFTDGTDQTCTSLNWIGTSGSKITLRGTGTAGWKISDTTGTNNCEWLDIDYSTAEGGATFNATNSTDGGHNSGWNITAPILGSSNFFNFI